MALDSIKSGLYMVAVEGVRWVLPDARLWLNGSKRVF